jgi:hypothetical protein
MRIAMRSDCLPNVFIIGAAKCGTTSLHHYLDQHPDISMSRVKEPHVFSEGRWATRYDHYDGLFDCQARFRGDSSTTYSRFPVEGDAAARIHAAVPDAKLIYLVGDPIERTISDYAHHVARGLEQRSVDDALKDFADPENYYAAGSRYALQAGRYLEHFPASSFLVLDQSDLRDRRAETMHAVFSFIGVDPTFRSPEFEVELLKRGDYLKRGSAGWRLRESGLGQLFRRLPLRPRLRVARMARRVLPTEPRPALDPTLEAELAEFLMPEVEQLRSMSGKPLEGLLATADPRTS